MIGKLATIKDFNNICLVEEFDCLQIEDKFVTSTKEVFECLPFFTFQSWADTSHPSLIIAPNLDSNLARR